MSAGLTAKTKGLSITSDPRRATHATSATATPERTPCILFIPRARKPSCVINVPLKHELETCPCKGVLALLVFLIHKAAPLSSLVLRGGVWVFWRAQQPSLCFHPPRPSSIARCSPRARAFVPTAPQRAPSFTVKLVRMLSSHIAIRKAIRFFPGKSTEGDPVRQWRPWLALAFAQDGAGRWPPPAQGVLGKLQPSLPRDTDVWKP